LRVGADKAKHGGTPIITGRIEWDGPLRFIAISSNKDASLAETFLALQQTTLLFPPQAVNLPASTRTPETNDDVVFKLHPLSFLCALSALRFSLAHRRSAEAKHTQNPR
jgi:hypothetical protein